MEQQKLQNKIQRISYSCQDIHRMLLYSDLFDNEERNEITRTNWGKQKIQFLKNKLLVLKCEYLYDKETQCNNEEFIMDIQNKIQRIDRYITDIESFIEDAYKFLFDCFKECSVFDIHLIFEKLPWMIDILVYNNTEIGHELLKQAVDTEDDSKLLFYLTKANPILSAQEKHDLLVKALQLGCSQKIKETLGTNDELLAKLLNSQLFYLLPENVAKKATKKSEEKQDYFLGKYYYDNQLYKKALEYYSRYKKFLDKNLDEQKTFHYMMTLYYLLVIYRIKDIYDEKKVEEYANELINFQGEYLNLAKIQQRARNILNNIKKEKSETKDEDNISTNIKKLQNKLEKASLKDLANELEHRFCKIISKHDPKEKAKIELYLKYLEDCYIAETEGHLTPLNIDSEHIKEFHNLIDDIIRKIA